MQIKRDYTKPLFRDHRKKRGTWRWILLYFLFIGAFLFFVDSQFSKLQLMALDMIGQAPPPTPFASELATQGMNLFMSGDMQGARDYFRCRTWYCTRTSCRRCTFLNRAIAKCCRTRSRAIS